MARKKTAATVLRAAAKLADHAARAAKLEAAFDEVTNPGELVRPWFDAALEVPGNRAATGERALALANDRPHDAPLLDALGNELARRNFTDEAIEVFRAAIEAGSTSDMTVMLLGYLLLVKRQDAAGVPLLEKALENDRDWLLPRQSLAIWFVTRDPARALAILEDPYDGEELELRAMALEALGRRAEADRESAEALTRYRSPLEARYRLGRWHTFDDRHPRAFVHARELLVLRDTAPKAQLDEIDEVIVRGYRHTGQLADLLPWLRARQEPFPLRIGFHVHFGLTALQPNPDPDLAMRAARDVAAAYRTLGDKREARLWAIREAGIPAKNGDLAPLDRLVESGLDDDPDAWVEVAHRYLATDHYAAATAAADRALVLDPSSGGALVVTCQLALSGGDADTLHRIAMALVAQKPMWHQGPEYLARSFARRLDAAAALMHSEKSLAMATFCHNAWTARAEAFVIAGELDAARPCVERSLAIRNGEHGDDILIVAAALARDRDRLEREIAKRYSHLSALPFTVYFERLRAIAG